MRSNKLSIFLLLTMVFGFKASAQNFEITALGNFPYSNISNSQKLSDVWGHEINGVELALVGLWDGFSVLDISDPANISELERIPGPPSVWRDIKTYGNYAYVSHDFVDASSTEEAIGILILDLTTAGQPNPDYVTFNYGGYINTVHNIYIDENGVLYLFGSDFNQGGAAMFDLTEDEMAPVFLGMYDGTYLHDGYVRGDTLWGGAINDGDVRIIDVSDKENPIELASFFTPNFFSHNCWPSDDGKYLFTSDEVSDATFAAYDVSDLSNIEFMSSIQSSFSTDVIPHNAHFFDNFIVNSFYRDGLQIVDVSRPEMMVEVGRYDSSPNFVGNGFNGAWGAYPYLPSGNALISDMEEGLYVVQPSYKRASFYEGLILDITDSLPLANVELIFNGDTVVTDINGDFLFGQRENGLFNASATKAAYSDNLFQVSTIEGQTTLDTIYMTPVGFGIAELEKMVDVYPNPAKDQIFIDAGSLELNRYRIYVPNGVQVVENELIGETSHQKIDLSGLSTGIYILELETAEKQLLHKRFVKK